MHVRDRVYVRECVRVRACVRECAWVTIVLHASVLLCKL